MWFSILFGLFLIAFAVMMLVRNQAAWRSAQTDALEGSEREFLSRQHRRRRQTCVMIAIVGVAVILGIWVTDVRAAAAYWLGVVLLVCWMALLAVVDLVATRMHFGRLHRDQQAERIVLEAELDQIRRRGSNGRPRNEPPEDVE